MAAAASDTLAVIRKQYALSKFEVAGLIATTILSLFALIQSIKAVRIAEHDFRERNRSKLDIQVYEVIWEPQIEVKFRIRNVGPAPATIIDSNVELRAALHSIAPERSSFSGRARSPIHGITVLNANDAALPLNYGPLPSVDDGGLWSFFFGLMTYRDGTRKERERGFCIMCFRNGLYAAMDHETLDFDREKKA